MMLLWKIKKILVNIICAFVPKKAWRHKIRNTFLKPPSTHLTLEEIQADIRNNTMLLTQCLQEIREELIRNNTMLLTQCLQEIREELKRSKYNTLLLPQAEKMHAESFSKFESIHKGRDVVLLATGPTASYYKPIRNAIHVGVNAAFKMDCVKLDYFFMQDFKAIRKYMQSAIDYRRPECIKFFGILAAGFQGEIIPSCYVEQARAYRYITGSPYTGFSKDLTKNIMPELGSVVFPAISFSLYTSPKRIFLVGCDCTDKGYFNGNIQTGPIYRTAILDGWRNLKEFAAEFYPEVEIYSINPISLRDVFIDVYTDEFLSANPDVKGQTLESIVDL